MSGWNKPAKSTSCWAGMKWGKLRLYLQTNTNNDNTTTDGTLLRSNMSVHHTQRPPPQHTQPRVVRLDHAPIYPPTPRQTTAIALLACAHDEQHNRPATTAHASPAPLWMTLVRPVHHPFPHSTQAPPHRPTNRPPHRPTNQPTNQPTNRPCLLYTSPSPRDRG